MRTLDYLNEVDNQGGAMRRQLERIAGDWDNFKRWETRLVIEWRVLEIAGKGEKKCYRKTDRGEKIHESLREWKEGLYQYPHSVRK